MELSIVIVNWNTQDLLRDCLDSVKQEKENATELEIEVLVVDNGSIDGSQETIQLEYPWVKLIANKENFGFAPANNQGVREAHGNLILFLNSDTQLTPGVLEKMIFYMKANPEVGICGPRLIFPDGSKEFSYGQFPTLWREWLGLVGKHHWDLDCWDFTEPLNVDWVTGACLMIRKQCLDQLQGWDERFFMFGEEVDLCFRCKKAGWRVILIFCNPVIHVGGGSTGQTPERVLRLYRGKIQYFSKHYSQTKTRILIFLIKFSILNKGIFYHILARVDSRFKMKKELWVAIWKAISLDGIRI